MRSVDVYYGPGGRRSGQTAARLFVGANGRDSLEAEVVTIEV